uniref:ATP-binding cassette transporter subfamily D member 4 n=1 Tax=Brachionus rotundiformis TaxID=96890 RepID=A0A7H9SKY7_9BILA|nr:ATP-binding cassette transporter subfamily D member 4 [Brachionus rotundiformis]
MNSIFNYIRGDEYPNPATVSSHRYKLSHIFESCKLFFKYLSKVLKHLFPSLKSASFVLFLVLLIDVVLLEFVVYRVGLFSGRYYKVLSERDLPAFWPLAATSIAYIAINAFMKSIKDFVTNLLSIVWRKYITISLHESYFRSKNFYYLQHQFASIDDSVNILIDGDGSVNNSKIQKSNRRPLGVQNSVEPILGELNSSENKINGLNEIRPLLDNPDQRITQDVKSLCTSIANIVPLILISPFVIGWYGYQTYITVGYSGPLAVVVYFLVGTLINGPLTAPIARVIYKQDKKEGDFRFKHMNLRINAESIAFYDSNQNELNKINENFNQLLNVSYRRNWKELILKQFINLSQYFGGILAYLVLAIPIFTHVYDDYSPTDLAQLISNYSFKCQYLIYLFTRLYDILNEISSIVGNTRRIGELIEKMSQNIEQRSLYERKKLIEPADGSCLQLENLTLQIPDENKVLVKNLNFKFKKGENVLISGRSGCGKTSLFRCISGLWNSYSGQIRYFIDPNEIFFLPQISYFTSGSLFEQICYPSSSQTLDNETSKNIVEWLREFRLSHLLDKVNSDLNFVPEFNWSSILSEGEKQRLSFLRVLYHRPKFALLDEFTSSVDQETEALMYEYLSKIECSFMSIAHRDTAKKFHQIELMITKKKVSSPLKWQIVGLLKSRDKKQNEIANMLGVSPKCVSSTKKRYEETVLCLIEAVLSPIERSKSGVNRDLIRELMIGPESFTVTSPILRASIVSLQNGGGSAGISNIYTGRINQFVYIDTLENKLLPSVELLFEPDDPWIFQQDGGSAHTAHSVRDWLKEQNIEVLPWCARSPDLNQNENLWSYVDAKMVYTKITSIQHLKEVLHNEWLKIPTEYVQKVIESMPKRVLACYKAKGGHFKY